AVYPFLTITGSASRGPAALTIYCDFDRVNFWCGLQVGGPRFTSPLQREHASGPHALTPASTAVVQTATRQLAQLFDTERVPDPLLTSFRYWSDDDEFGAAYHLWGLGADDPAVMRRLVEPVPGLFVANEAWSDMQGWVNGALRSADLVLERFGITSLAADSAHPPCGLPLQPTVNAR
ncbi:MAG TPA: FAD-dependent oxidoreductase, partial [Gemmatimonadales bacterium]|nr:FAD-dependent oxidoreductase [Gemmatimonadales bacterium]